MITFRTLQNTTPTALLDCFNHAFSDYQIPFKLSLDQLNTKLLIEDIKLESSVGAFRNNNLVGFMLHGVRTLNGVNTAYNAGTGVIPNERGNALTLQMYNYILAKLKSEGINKIILEVISSNQPAIKSYQKVGFKKTRTLNCYKGKINSNVPNPEVMIKTTDFNDFQDYDDFVDITPSWQNTLESISNMKMNKILLCAYKLGKACGYAIINDSNYRILQIAVHKNMRRNRIASSILQHFKNEFSPNISIINVDAKYDSVYKFFLASGLNNFLQQDEMELKI